MDPIFSKTGYSIKRQGLAIGGKYRVFELNGKVPLLFAEVKSSFFTTDIEIHFYQDEKKKQEILTVKTCPDTPPDHLHVFDAQSGEKIGALVTSADTAAEFFKDAYAILDASDQPIGKFFDKSVVGAIARDILSHALPQTMQVMIGEMEVGTVHQKLKAFGYELEIDFSADVSNQLDRRMAIAIGMFVACEQGKEAD